MQLKGSKTEKNLMEAFAGECEARSKYTWFAEKAKEEGYIQFSQIFEETAGNELEHAEIWYEFLTGDMPDVAECLARAIAGEHAEWSEMYPRMACEAKEEGFDHIAELFTKVAKIEKSHEERYRKLAENLKNNEVFARQEPQMWQCMNCGYTHIGRCAPRECPVCGFPQGYFEIKAKNY